MERQESGTARPPLRARLFGRTEIAVGDRVIPDEAWRRRAPRSLLLLLLGTPGHRLRRDAVLDALWPDVTLAAALNALYKAIHALRRVLEPELNDARASAYVRLADDAIWLAAGPGDWVDVDAFAAALSRAEAMPAEERRPALRATLDLYSGDFLADEPYADWPVARREALRQARERAALALAALDLAAGEPLGAAAALHALLAGDPTNEEAHRALMRAYAAARQPDYALRQYERCRAALAEDLGAEPGPETEALRAEIEQMTPEQAPLPAAWARPRPFHNLPAPPTPLVGRETEVAELEALFWRPDVRLVTLTGPGGIGKTRLALEVAAGLADDFADGVAFVALAPLEDATLVVPAIARTLEIGERAGQPAEAALRAALEDRSLLLVLDNVEHVIDAAPAVADLLAGCRRLKILATSREALRVRGEHERVVHSLGLPSLDRLPAHRVLPRYGAIALFRQAVLARRPDFELTAHNARAVAEICVRLDGLPLALELAAAHCRHLAPESLLARLTRPLDLLTDGPRDLPRRQQTLRDAIAWSYDRLPEDERAVFRRLGVFAGGCSPAAVETVSRGVEKDAIHSSAARLLASLVDKSLITWEPVDDGADPPAGDDGPRVRMLETIREYALERLEEAGEAEVTRRAHAAYFLSFAEATRPDLDSHKQVDALDRLESEADNLRTALGWTLGRPEPAMALRLVGALWRFWRVRGYFTEGRAWVERALAVAGADDPVAEVLLGASKLATAQGDLAEGIRLAEASRASAGGDPAPTAAALGTLAALAIYQGRLDEAVGHNDEALALYRAIGNEWGTADCLNRQGLVAYLRQDYAAAQPLLEASVDLFRRVGDRRVAAVVAGNLGVVTICQGDLDRAIALYEESIATSRQVNDRGLSILILANLADAVRQQGEVERATELVTEALRLAVEVGDRRAVANALYSLGTLRRAGGDAAGALATLAEGLGIFRALGDRIEMASSIEAMADLIASFGRPDLGARLLGAVDRLREERGAPLQAWEDAYAGAAAGLRASLDSEAFRAAWVKGRSTFEETVAAAVEFAAASPPG